jgi:hypothetical protein
LDLELLMVNSRHDSQFSDQPIKDAKMLVAELGLEDAVRFHTDFLPDEQSFDLLRSADAIVFAYQNTGESASAAVRTGIASGRPVLVTPLSIFDDADEAVIRFEGITPRDIADGLVRLDASMRDGPELVAGIAASAERWARANACKNVSAFLASEIAYRARTDAWLPEFASDWGETPMMVGERVGNGVVASRPGIVCHGPYCTLQPGQYRVVIHGAVEGLAPKCEVRLTAEGGATLFVAALLSEIGDNLLADIFLELRQIVRGFELTIVLGDNTRLVLEDYQVLRRFG